MIVKAFATAKRLHEGQYRKGKEKIPYIVHPMKVATILIKFKQPDYVIAAGFLHDVIEDTDYSFEDLEKDFDQDVVRLVRVATELDSQAYGWKERKEASIAKVRKAKDDEKILVCADKLANVTDMIYDYKRIKDDVWKKFIRHFPKERRTEKLIEWYYQYSEWYYKEMLKALSSDPHSIADEMIFKDYESATRRLFSTAPFQNLK